MPFDVGDMVFNGKDWIIVTAVNPHGVYLGSKQGERYSIPTLVVPENVQTVMPQLPFE